MPKRFIASAMLALFAATGLGVAAESTPNYSKEAAVIESMSTDVQFATNGTRTWHQQMAVRIQSEAALRQYGILGFSYEAASEDLTFEFVRVHKADGTVVETPVQNVMDAASPVQAAAPMYTDTRQKQLPVKSLGVGDVMEYSVRSVQKTPEAAGQFWYSHTFVNDAVVLNERLTVTVPRDRYLHVESPRVNADVREDGGMRIYMWKHSHLEPAATDSKKLTAEREGPRVRLTTFKTWAEVGAWWAELSQPEAQVTPAVEAKAKELTEGLRTEDEKARAIYRYVALRFRYISISLGEGRYRPRTAQEVLANQYGDCKDKHTLLTSLLKAAGVEAWPALIGAGIKFESSVPSPEQFNHVITVLPHAGEYVWLDTTAEVAPFGLLHQSIRDHEALVIPITGQAQIMKTPVNPPTDSSQVLNITASLDANGTLKGHFDFTLTGDAALAMRSGFHELAPSEWQTLAQQISYALNYGGEVSGVSVDGLEDLEKPFHYSYDYTRKNYSGWEQHQIAAPLPPLQFGPGDEADRPEEAFWAGARGKLSYHAEVKLPMGYRVALPNDADANTAFAGYKAHYALADETLVADRTMTIRRPKVETDQWEVYKSFFNALRSDQSEMLAVSAPGWAQTKVAAASR